ncbi:Uncharacterised protein [Bordetella pertussis]|nr:Uncharacterised protein [Bordetella pertussis]CFO71683.1 Uncharacterised protein [Bordetella pertussis]CFU83079.1 Uncharacterised protein [Bordetella pertussis]CPM13071.1 Uncharacterised protein [Bordetella pertussis]CPN59663.1 Uncharacterised protein [Bordetella pertussis]
MIEAWIANGYCLNGRCCSSGWRSSSLARRALNRNSTRPLIVQVMKHRTNRLNRKVTV